MIRKNFSFDPIRQYRLEIMGIAILWICFFHSKIILPQAPSLWPLWFVKFSGYAGVDIFFMLSGFGLIHGWQRHQCTLRHYLSRRVNRLIPSFFLFLSIGFLVDRFIGKPVRLEHILYSYSMLGFWLDHSQEYWFVPAIFFLYCLFPFYIKVYLKQPEKFKFTAYGVAALIFLSITVIPTGFNHLLIFIIRVPIFLIGIHIGYCLLNNSMYLSRVIIPVNIFLCITGFWILFIVMRQCPPGLRITYGLYWYPLVIAVPSFLIIIAFMLEKINKINFIESLKEPFYKFLRYMGEYSLEIYLIHDFIFRHSRTFQGWFAIQPQSGINFLGIPEYFIYFLISLLFAKFLKKWAVIIRVRI